MPGGRFVLTAKRLWITFAAVFMFSLAIAAYTNSAWEDWFITYRASKNLAMGNGLVYTVGERLHSFTSPLGTLIPALLSFITGSRSDDLVLWLFRIIGCILLGLSAMILLKIAHATGMFLLSATAIVGLFAVDAKIVAFSTNGMETAFMMFFLATLLHVLLVPRKHPEIILGLTWGGLMWTRPDSFIYIGGLIIGFLVFAPVSQHLHSRREMVKKFSIAGVIAAVVYLPWIVWAWQYYGSPIPHTIIAKGLSIERPDISFLKQLVISPFILPFFGPLNSSFAYTFLPTDYYFGGWPLSLVYGCTILAFLCAYAWLMPFVSRLTRAVSIALFLGHFYLIRFPGTVKYILPWYIPMLTLLSIVVIGLVIQQILVRLTMAREISRRQTALAARFALKIAVSAIILVSLTVTIVQAYQARLIQEITEEGQRKPLGLWLKENAASPNDRVFVECLGYIGFYSQLKMLDFPGLASREVVEARSLLQTDDYGPLIEYLKPDWVILRDVEINKIEQTTPGMLAEYYDDVKSFNESARIKSYANLQVYSVLMYNETFHVFKSKRAAKKLISRS